MKSANTTLCTYDDYLLIPDDGNRYEIIGGELSIAPAPFTNHQSISENLEDVLRPFLKKTQWGKMFHAPVDVILSMTEIVQPDIIVIAHSRREIITKRNIVAAPDLVIEILSPATALRDQTTKKALYEKYGVKEYWIVDPDNETIELFVLEKNILIGAGGFVKGDSMSSRLLTGLEVEITPVFRWM